ncbi:hypothetical protein P12x_005608 [Tundrisphaera lichenicola]|uniref:hypothetical protein n=1 Tax=Tundrisphaera lichenicola TaxID=2029860 RepID=UPI003EB9AAC6
MRILARLILATLMVFGGCNSPENGRPRGGGNGGDGGNYVRGRIDPPSKIDATKDLRRIDHYGAGPTDWR